MAQVQATNPLGRTPTRSLHGCWTCRVRKKKCDETRPVCSTCLSLDLECEGYGERPMWMDSGPLQREHAQRVKNALTQRNSQKRRRHSGRSRSERHGDIGSITQELVSASSDAPSNYSSDGAQTQVSEWDAEVWNNNLSLEAHFNNWGMDLDLDMIDKSFPMPMSEDSVLATEPEFNVTAWANATEQSNDDIARLVSKDHALLLNDDFDGSEAKPCLPPNSLALQGPSKQSSSMAQEDVPAELNLFLHTGWSQSSQSNTTHHKDDRPIIKEASHFQRRPGEALLCQDREDVLTLHYLDDIFYTQYPFYNTPIRQSRSWLFSLIRKAPSVYHATLALSDCHLESTMENCATPSVRGKNYYNLALREMEIEYRRSSTLSGTARIVHAIECLACILQMLYYEHFTNGERNWRAHLLAAADLILPLTKLRLLSSTSPPSDIQNIATVSQERYLDVEDNAGIRVLLGSIISYDIIAAASTRSRPSLKLDHESILRTFEINLHTLIGCTNRVMTLILEVAHLDTWKKELEKTRKLSMVELVRRGTRIEEQLQQQIVGLQSRSTKDPGSVLSVAQTEMAYIFALSALTYLHVVVSGAHPEMPEIAANVSRTLSAFQSLSEPRLLQNLIWPFCVSGCLALEGQQKAFCELVSKAELTCPMIGTRVQAFDVITECWEMRKLHKSHCDWVSAMDKLGYNLLLI